MFFLARSALCIGLVAVAASTSGGAPLGATVEGGTREVARAAGDACLRSAGCLRIGAELLSHALTPQPSPGEAARVSSPPALARVPAPHRAAAARGDGASKG